MSLRDTPWRTGLRFQFLLVVVAVLIVLVTIFIAVETYIGYFFTRQVDENNMLISQSVALRIDHQLEDIAAHVEGIAVRPEIQSMDPGTQDPIIVLGKELNPVFERLFILDKEGNVITALPADPNFTSRNYGNAIYFRKPIETKRTYFSDVFVENNQLLTVIATPIRAADGQVIGTVNATASLSTGEIPEFVTGLNIGNNGYTILVDRVGTIIMHPDQKRVLRQESLRDFPAVKNVMRGETGAIECPLGGEDKLCSYSPVKLTGWGVVIVRPIGEVYPYLVWIRLGLAFLFILGLGMLVAFFIHGRKMIIDPIATMTKGVEKVSAGEFDYHLRIKEPEEMVELAHAFNTMTKMLSTFRGVTSTLNSMAGLGEIEDFVLEQIGSILQTDMVSILLFGEDDILKIGASRGISDEAIMQMNATHTDRKRFEKTLGADVVDRLRNGQSVLVSAEEAPALHRVMRMEGVRYLYFFPLLVEKRLHGLIMAMSFSEKPFTQERVHIISSIGDHIAVAIQRSDLYDRLYKSYAQTTRAIARAIDAKDIYNKGHSEGVANTAVKIAGQMGLSEEQIRGVEIAAYLHDVGKIGISEEILRKPAQLSLEEEEIINQHPSIGADILEPIEFPWPVLEAVRHHHERYDGKGYPGRVAGKDIVMEGRILAVADAFESMVSDRPYRSAMTQSEIIEQLKQGLSQQFDPDVANALLALVEDEGAYKLAENGEIDAYIREADEDLEESDFLWPGHEEMEPTEQIIAEEPEEVEEAMQQELFDERDKEEG